MAREAPSAKEGGYPMPIQLGDHSDGRDATEQYLEQHAAAARVKVRIDWGFEEKPSHQHEKRQR